MPKDIEKIKQDLSDNWRLCPNCDVVVSIKKGFCPICKSKYNPETNEWILTEVKADKDVKKAKGDESDDPLGDWLLGKEEGGGEDESEKEKS